MPNYDFALDLPIAQATEQEVAHLMQRHYNWQLMMVSENSDYDLMLTKDKQVITVEVKEDFSCERTGNVGVEFECRGKPSGIATTYAMCYVYKIHTKDGIEFRGILTNDLKKIIARGLYFRIVSVGDVGSNSKNYLFKYDVFAKYSMKLFESNEKALR